MADEEYARCSAVHQAVESAPDPRLKIGLRLAVGALPGQVMAQFLSEAVMIALIGAAAGLFVGVIGIMK